MQTQHLGSRRMLELGCGLGLASLVLHRRLADITASDCHPLAEAFLKNNLLRNRLPPMKYATGNWTRANAGLGRFDLIIGSDVLYERNHPGQLVDFIGDHAAPSAEVVVIDPNRSNRQAFKRGMASLGFSLVETRLDAPLQDGSAFHGRVLRFQREDEAALA